MENNYLKFVITEDIYLINESKDAQSTKQYKAEELDKETNAPIVEEPKVEIATPKLAIKGNDESKVIILNFDEASEFISQQNENFLTNILKAIGLDLTSIALLNNATADTSLDVLQSKTNGNTILTFGLPHNTDFNSRETYEIITKKGFKILSADSLTTIEGDVEKKKLLWGNLKTLFIK